MFKFAYFKIFGLPVLYDLGIIALLLMMTAALVAILIIKGKIRASIKVHGILAGLGLIFALIHAVMALWLYLA